MHYEIHNFHDRFNNSIDIADPSCKREACHKETLSWFKSPSSLCGSVVEHWSAEFRLLKGTRSLFCLTLVTRRKTSFSYSLPRPKLTISLIFFKSKGKFNSEVLNFKNKTGMHEIEYGKFPIFFLKSQRAPIYHGLHTESFCPPSLVLLLFF